MPASLEDSLTLHSPEGVSLELPLCGPGARMLAYSIDYMLLLVLGTLISVLALGLSMPLLDQFGDWFESVPEQLAEDPNDRGAINAILLPILVIAFLCFFLGEFLYFTIWEVATGGRSPGKMLIKLRVVGRDGMPPDLSDFAIRNLLRIVDALPSGYAFGLLCIVLTERGQRLGDLAAGTVVVRTDFVEVAPAMKLPEHLIPLPLSRDQLERLGANELSLARGALRRREQLDNERAHAVVSEAAQALRRRLELEEDPSERPMRFLQRVVLTAEQRARRD